MSHRLYCQSQVVMGVGSMSALIRQKDSDMKACFKSSAIKVKKSLVPVRGIVVRLHDAALNGFMLYHMLKCTFVLSCRFFHLLHLSFKLFTELVVVCLNTTFYNYITKVPSLINKSCSDVNGLVLI